MAIVGAATEVENVIEAVRKYACVWNIALKDNRVKENAWKLISEEVKISVDDCKKKWKGLRHKYVRELKAVKKKKKNRYRGSTTNIRLVVLQYYVLHS